MAEDRVSGSQQRARNSEAGPPRTKKSACRRSGKGGKESYYRRRSNQWGLVWVHAMVLGADPTDWDHQKVSAWVGNGGVQISLSAPWVADYPFLPPDGFQRSGWVCICVGSAALAIGFQVFLPMISAPTNLLILDPAPGQTNHTSHRSPLVLAWLNLFIPSCTEHGPEGGTPPRLNICRYKGKYLLTLALFDSSTADNAMGTLG